MPDERTICLARNWAGWVGEQLAAQVMGVSVETLKGWLLRPPSTLVSTPTSTQNQKKGQNNDVCERGEPAANKAKRYTTEQKAEALQLVQEIGLSKASRETGVSIASLIKWRNDADTAR